jgi:hypothetical protein
MAETMDTAPGDEAFSTCGLAGTYVEWVNFLQRYDYAPDAMIDWLVERAPYPLRKTKSHSDRPDYERTDG